MRPVTPDDLDVIAALGADAHGRFFITRGDAFVGLAGLSRTDFDAGIVPGIEIAWRLVFEHWGQGYATEAARACFEDAATRLGIHDVIAATAVANARSRAVMERLGMVLSPKETFEHPRGRHVVYRRQTPNLRGRLDDGLLVNYICP